MYSIGTYITDPIGNNEFSFQERIALGSKGKIFVPNLIQGNVDNLEIGSEIVFEEVMNNKLISCIGLKHFIKTSLFTTEGNPVDKEGEGDLSKGIPVYIVDNHNHALSFWYTYIKKASAIIGKNLLTSLIHIDQHADTKPNTNICPPLKENVELFVNEKTNVGNFITAAINSGIIDKVIQIRTDYALDNLEPATWNLQQFILDIDIDFRVDKEITPEDIHIIRKLMKKAKLITIATSPYFIDQNQAIAIIKKLLA